MRAHVHRPFSPQASGLLPVLIPVLCLALLALGSVPAHAAEPARGLSTGQLIYVPAYAHTYHGASKRPFFLTVTLSVHNTDPARSIILTRVDYYSTQGALISHMLEKPITLPPLVTTEFVVREKKDEGGPGDNFLVRWESGAPANPPIAETVMIGTASTQGISFSSRGVPISE